MGTNYLEKRTRQERLIIAKTLLETVLDDMPSAEPKIIRCKDCRRYNGRPCGLVNWYNGKEDFCSRATERGDQK